MSQNYINNMDNVCGICFQTGELFQVPGYGQPTCNKCTDQLATKTLVSSFYRNHHHHHHHNHHRNNNSSSNNITGSGGGGGGSGVSSGGVIGLVGVGSSSGLGLIEQMQQTENQANITNVLQNMNPNIKKNEHFSFDLDQALMNPDNEQLVGEEGSCPVCSKYFSRRTSLLNHIRNHSAEKKYVCTYCQKGFTQAANLRNHERIHTNERPYICVDCGKAFTQITNLNNHRRLHTGERPFVCVEADCGRAFAQVTNLNNHMKTHHKVQTYPCTQCSRKFVQLTQLNNHLNSHNSGVRSFFCPQCPNKAYKQQAHLQQHMRTQHQIGLNGEKLPILEAKYKCTMCSSAFTEELMLKKHIQRHIDGRYYTCSIPGCNQGFTIKSHLQKHLHQCHSIEFPKRMAVNKQRTNQIGKHNCYFESCDESFDDAEQLNNHIHGVHGLSIVKNAGKKSKMDYMLTEQLNKMKENNLLSSHINAANAAGIHHHHHLNPHHPPTLLPPSTFSSSLLTSQQHQQQLQQQQHNQHHHQQQHLQSTLSPTTTSQIAAAAAAAAAAAVAAATSSSSAASSSVVTPTTTTTNGGSNSETTMMQDYAERFNVYRYLTTPFVAPGIQQNIPMQNNHPMFQSTKRVLSVSELLNQAKDENGLRKDGTNGLSDLEPKLSGIVPETQAHFQLDKKSVDYHHRLNNGSGISSGGGGVIGVGSSSSSGIIGNIMQTTNNQEQINPAQMKLVCNFCYNVFKTPQTLGRHIDRFHSQN